MEIKDIIARQILDSRGNPTVEADVWLNNGTFGRAAVPSGASTGSHEAHELRDGGKEYGGLSVMAAISNIHKEIKPALLGIMADDQFKIDQIMVNLDGTDNKSRLGANAILAVSMASAWAASKARGLLLYQHIADIAGATPKYLPMPMMNILNGGKHAIGGSDIQETMIIPNGADTFSTALRMGSEIFHALKLELKISDGSTLVGDEGGFVIFGSNNNTTGLDLLGNAIKNAGYLPQNDILYALDVAASELYKNNLYYFESSDAAYTAVELIDWYKKLTTNYPIVSIEDGLAEDDWLNWQFLHKELGRNIQLVGDDLLVTNIGRLQKCINMNAANAILIKPNQIGTLTETIKAIQLAQANKFGVIVSHRSGETEDVSIVHIAIGTNAGQIKTGSLSRSERIAKYNELLRIEQIDPSLKLFRPFDNI